MDEAALTRNVNGIKKRLKQHCWDCKDCLRSMAGLRNQGCGTGSRIQGQLDTVQKALKRHLQLKGIK